MSQADSPVVSVVVPCYNAGRTLAETLESAMAQTFASIEVVVVDDGSTDPDTLRALGEVPPGVRVVRQENRGLPGARNAGIRESTGVFILPLDADDLIEPEYVEQAVAVLQAEPAVGIVYCHADVFGEDAGAWDLPEYSLDRLLIENCIFSCAMFRRADWEAVGGYNEAMRTGREDHDFWLRLAGLGREVRRLPGRYFHYRVTSGSMNSSYTREQYVEMYSEIIRSNSRLYLDHIEVLVRHRFEQQDAINDLRYRYAALERLRGRFPVVYRALRAAKRGVRGRVAHE
jgi:glycosyltransferase involved in cell wall biosynthesis